MTHFNFQEFCNFSLFRSTASEILKTIIFLSPLIYSLCSSVCLPQVSVAKDIEFANRMAVLAGDFLLANACTGLARLGSTRVVQLIANAISNLMEAR